MEIKFSMNLLKKLLTTLCLLLGNRLFDFDFCRCINNTIESCNYAPALCMLALDKSGEGAYSRDRYISISRPLPTIECHVGVQSLYFSGCLMGKLEKNDK